MRAYYDSSHREIFKHFHFLWYLLLKIKDTLENLSMTLKMWLKFCVQNNTRSIGGPIGKVDKDKVSTLDVKTVKHGLESIRYLAWEEESSKNGACSVQTFLTRAYLFMNWALKFDPNRIAWNQNARGCDTEFRIHINTLP